MSCQTNEPAHSRRVFSQYRNRSLLYEKKIWFFLCISFILYSDLTEIAEITNCCKETQMITVTEKIESFPFYHEFLSDTPEQCLFFDIETTGLSAAYSTVFLIGTVSFRNGQWTLTQYFAEHASEEKEILSAFFASAASHDVLIHFNGTTFDIPYLNTRAAACHLTCTTQNKISVDLYRTFRPLKNVFSLERMNQSSLESLVRWHRQDRLTGKQMVSLYRKYDASGEPGLRDLLLLHNHDDMLGMTKILNLSAFLLLLQGQITSVSTGSPFPPECIKYGRNTECEISFTTASPLPFPLAASCTLPSDTDGESLTFRITAADTEGILRIPCYYGEMLYFFPDYRNYFFLPLENQAIHKSVAAFVEKEYRIPAKPSNCYTRQSGFFLSQPDGQIHPAFRTSYESKNTYFLYPGQFDEAQMRSYVSSVISFCFSNRHGTGWVSDQTVS